MSLLASESWGTAVAEEAAQPVRIERFQKANGLPSNAIQTTITDGNGYLWVATGQGLARFDGRRWRVFDSRNTPALISSEIRNLHLLRDGRLLIALASGAILLRDGDRFEPLSALDFAANQVHEDAAGTLTLAGVKLLQLAAGKSPHTLLDNSDSGELIQFAAKGDRRFVLSPRSGLIREWSGADSTPLRMWQLDAVDAEDLLTAWDNEHLWIVSTAGRWRLNTRNGDLEKFERRLALKPKVAARGPDGWWWIGGRGDRSSLCRMSSLESEAPCEPVPVDARNITALAMDARGALWVSSWDAGLFRITTPPITTFGSGRVQSLLALDDGGVIARSEWCDPNRRPARFADDVAGTNRPG